MYEGNLYDEATGPSSPRRTGFFPQSAGSWEETFPDVDFTVTDADLLAITSVMDNDRAATLFAHVADSMGVEV